MDNQSKIMVVGALMKVVDSAPTLYPQVSYFQPYTSPRSDISVPEFSTWVNYANQTLNIAYNYTGLSIVLSTKIEITQISSQQAVSYLQRVEQIKQRLLYLAKTINIM